MTPRHPPLPDARIALRRGPLHYTSAGSGAPLLLIHGSLCDYRYWRWQIPAFSATHHVVAPSLRGCWPDAGTHPQAGYRIDAHARDLAELLEALHPHERWHILGHSRGAQVALALACLVPERCRSLTLADPAFRFTDEPAEPSPYGGAIAQLTQGQDADHALAAFVDTANGQDTWAHMASWFRDMARANVQTLRSQALEGSAPVAPEAVQALACPLLLVGGASSPPRFQSRLARLQALRPDATRVRIALAAHGMNLANPGAFNRSVLAFLQSAQALSTA